MTAQDHKPPPGWYPDPRDESAQRYFDGDRWSDDVEPRLDLDHTRVPRRINSRVLIAVAVALVLALVVAVLVYRSQAAGDPINFPTVTVDGSPEAQESPTSDLELIEGEDFDAGDEVSGSIEPNQVWVANMNVDSDAMVALDARPQSGDSADLMLQIRDEQGLMLGSNDDRGDLEFIGGEDLDPFLAANLGAGTYRIVVSTWLNEGEARFDLLSQVVEPVDDDGREDVSAQADAPILRAVSAPQDSEFRLAAQSDVDLTIALVEAATGAVTTFEPGSDVAESLDLDTTDHVLVLMRHDGSAGDLSYSVQFD